MGRQPQERLLSTSVARQSGLDVRFEIAREKDTGHLESAPTCCYAIVLRALRITFPPGYLSPMMLIDDGEQKVRWADLDLSYFQSSDEVL